MVNNQATAAEPHPGRDAQRNGERQGGQDGARKVLQALPVRSTFNRIIVAEREVDYLYSFMLQAQGLRQDGAGAVAGHPQEQSHLHRPSAKGEWMEGLSKLSL